MTTRPAAPTNTITGQCQHLRYPERNIAAPGAFGTLQNVPGRLYQERALRLELCTLCVGMLLGHMTKPQFGVVLTWPDGSTVPEDPEPLV